MADNFSHIEDVIEESERTRGTDDERLLNTPTTRPNRARSPMLSLRVPPDAMTEIEQLAQKRDVPISALVRGWILEGLAASANSVPRTIDKIEAELSRLRGMVE